MCLILLGCKLMFINNTEKIINLYNELWTFQSNTLSIADHLIYFIILFSIIIDSSIKI